jgi:hypothetical protein
LATSPLIVVGLVLFANLTGLIADPVIGDITYTVLRFCMFYGSIVGCFSFLTLMCYSLYFGCNNLTIAGFILSALSLGSAYFMYMLLIAQSV